jgi:hypothetical protein
VAEGLGFLEQLAEARILEAQARGALADLPGAGRPLDLEEDALLAPELRMAYRVLRNAGCLPQEVALLREVRQVEALLAGLEDARERARALARLALLQTRLGERRAGWPPAREPYYDRLLTRLGTQGERR